MVFLIILAGSGMACAGAIPSVIAFEEGEQFNMTLSNINFNRLFIEGEAIIKLSYPQGSITVDQSEKDQPDIQEKSVYIKPNFQTPITLFVTTDKGHHVSLTLTPVESPGKTLRLMAKNQTKLKYVKSDNPEQTQLDEAIASMRAGEIPKDFKALGVIHSPFYIKKDIKVTLQKQYQGSGLTGYVYSLENTSKHDIALSTSLFSHPNAQSLALSQDTLLPKKVAYLYGVYSNQG
ncbi:MAG: type-F conjugative transfer system secretin TraK [Legionella sp.]|nr:type-F conjugative transfer system secretin TraK [Legionella sp.]